MIFFAIYRPNVNADETEFSVCYKQSKNSSINNATLNVGDHLMKQKVSVKHLGVYWNRNLNCQDEIKSNLRNMACSIKTNCYVRDLFPEKTRLPLFNSVVISHPQDSSILWNSISLSLIELSTSGNQLNWEIEACFIRYKRVPAQDLRIKHDIISVHQTLNMNPIKLSSLWNYILCPSLFQKLPV